MKTNPLREARWLRLIAISALSGCAAVAQLTDTSHQAPSPTPEANEFEVATIKPAAPNEGRVMLRMAPGGRVDARNVTLKILVEQAYGVRDFQISGGPSWVNTERFDVSAKAEGQPTPESVQAMMRTLLKNRFKLEIHKDTKELPMYLLTVAKSGPKLKAGSAPAPPSDAPPGPSGPRIRMGRGLIEAQNMPLSMLATTLGRQLGRSVEDRTGLAGTYDVKLEWTPDETQGGGMKEIGGDRAAPVDSTGPTIFAALQEQLGLKLESQKGPVEVVVIDRVEKPSEN